MTILAKFLIALFLSLITFFTHAQSKNEKAIWAFPLSQIHKHCDSHMESALNHVCGITVFRDDKETN